MSKKEKDKTPSIKGNEKATSSSIKEKEKTPREEKAPGKELNRANSSSSSSSIKGKEKLLEKLDRYLLLVLIRVLGPRLS
jgi:hypothetical protein